MAVYGNADRLTNSVLVVTAGFALVCVLAITSWTGFGQALRGFLSDPSRLKWFNIAMGVALALTLVPMLA